MKSTLCGCSRRQAVSNNRTMKSLRTDALSRTPCRLTRFQLLTLLATHALLLLMTVLAAYGAGTFALAGVQFRSHMERAGFQIAAGLATIGSTLFALALFGAVDRFTTAALCVPLAIAGA